MYSPPEAKTFVTSFPAWMTLLTNSFGNQGHPAHVLPSFFSGSMLCRDNRALKSIGQGMVRLRHGKLVLTGKGFSFEVLGFCPKTNTLIFKRFLNGSLKRQNDWFYPICSRG